MKTRNLYEKTWHFYSATCEKYEEEDECTDAEG